MRPVRLTLLALALASPTMPGAIQTAAFAQEATPAVAPPQTAPLTVPPSLIPPAPVPQPVLWTPAATRALLDYVQAIGQEGLDPATYSPGRLQAAIDSGDDAERNAVATPVFRRLMADLSGGYVRGDARVEWHMTENVIDPMRQQALLQRASQGEVKAVLDSLLPTHPQYAGLKAALAQTAPDDRTRRDLIRANMERWRWMPRQLGSRHIIVNVPAFTVALVDNGQVVTRHRVIVGARRTPTPQLNAQVTGITLNPWWNVPQSIVAEMGGRFSGYNVRRAENGRMIVRQPPGPRNALGRLKIEMSNPYAIYLHDTPAQNLFTRPVRAFSHGCIRTQYVRDFAADLLAATGAWDRDRIDSTIAQGDTVTVPLDRPVPVYIAYFTAAATTDGNIVTYPDIYGRDAPIRQALNRGSDGTQQASRE